MPKRQDPRRDRPTRKGDQGEHRKPTHKHGGETEDRGSGERQIFEEQIQKRLGGGATPTAEAYAEAMRQWQELPGAVQFVATPAFPKSDSGESPAPTSTPEKPKDGGEPV
jgi:hypothetical protein